MERARKIRSVARTAFTRVFNELKSELDSAESSNVEVETKFELLTLKFEELKGLDEEVYTSMIEADATEEQLDAENKLKEDYACKYFKVKLMLGKRAKECDNVSVQSENNTQKRNFKLPRIEFKKFNGEVKEWLAWWGQFSKIDQDYSIDGSDKFQYLIQSTAENSRAREIVESYPPSEENYPKALEALRSRFGKEDVLIEVYIRELLSLVLQNTRAGRSCGLTSLYDKLESHLRSLESLGITTEKCEAMLFPLVESCIPEDLLRVWQRQSTAGGKPKDRLKGLMNFIKQEVEGEERISIAMSGIKFEKGKATKEKRPFGLKRDEIPIAAGLLVSKENKIGLTNNCIFCDSSHVSDKCYSAQELSLEEMKKRAAKKKCCFVCLKPGHHAKACKMAVKCIICLRRHYPIMCPDLPSNKNIQNVEKMVDTSAKRVQQETKAVEALHARSCADKVYLQTILVRLIGKNGERTVRAIIDTGSQRSYVLKQAAVEMGYQPIKEEKIIHSLFGGNKTEVSKHDIYRICLGDLNDNYRCSLEALDHEVICGDISRIQKGPWIQELEEANIELTDVGEDTVPIEVLIGAEVAGKLFTGRCKTLNCGLAAIHTKLGWTVMGKLSDQWARENYGMLVTSMLVKNISLSDLWDLELIGIRDPVLQKTKEEVHQAAVIQNFEETVTIDDEGRYEVHLPWKEGHPPLLDNYEIVLRRHVPGEVNLADLPSRGCGAKELWESQWWEGPQWLKRPPQSWPKPMEEVDETEILKEKKKCVKSSLLTTEKPTQDWMYRYFSNFTKILRLVGWILRFIHNSRHPNDRKLGELTLEELKHAETYVIGTVQRESFDGIKDEKLSSLCPLEDENGILRIRTKVTEREDRRDFRYPSILPAKHPLVILLIQDQHKRHSHVGVQGLLSLLREYYWILGGRKAIEAAISKCTVCQRYSAHKVETVPASLPIHRVRDAAPFEVIGVDFAGPLHLRNKDKAWICLYTCAVYRAVHLELVSGLSTDKFIQTLRRFIARRGRPTVIFSDNGTNFVGGDHAFQRVDFNKIECFSVAQRIEWKFNPPSAAWRRGWWERLIRILKETLRKILGRARLDYEEMSTILCDCEALMNSRPLTYLSSDTEDLVALTPSMFLQEIKEVGVPDIDEIDSTSISARISYRQHLREAIRERFRREYLGQLHLKSTKGRKQQIRVGEIVLIGSDNLKRLDWPLAKVEELIPGRDGEVRVVRLKTSSGILLRPVQRLYRLEGIAEENNVKHKEWLMGTKEKTERIEEQKLIDYPKLTARGRKIRVPERLNL